MAKALGKKTVILVLLVAILAAYAVFRIANDFLLAQGQTAYQRGFEDGIRQSVAAIFSEVQTRGFVSVFSGNTTLLLAPVQPQPQP